MDEAKQDKGKTLLVTCEELVDIQLAGELHAQLKTALADGTKVEIAASKVERIDTAILQIFVAYFQAARAKGLEVSIHGASEGFRRAARLLGLDVALGLTD